MKKWILFIIAGIIFMIISGIAIVIISDKVSANNNHQIENDPPASDNPERFEHTVRIIELANSRSIQTNDLSQYRNLLTPIIGFLLGLSIVVVGIYGYHRKPLSLKQPPKTT